MARKYPRFLFSNPTNTKSKGPFIVHMMEPRFIARFEIIERPHLFSLHLIESFSGPLLESDQEFRDAILWCANNPDVQEFMSKK